MAKGNEILVNAYGSYRGKRDEGIVNAGETFYPGMIVQRDPTQSMQNARHVFKLYNADADGGRPKGAVWIVLADHYQGKLTTDSIAAGERCFLYCPLPGDQLNLLYKNESGTADDVAAGDIFIADDTTGKFTLTTGTPETEMAMALEAVTDPTADTLVWSEWTGY